MPGPGVEARPLLVVRLHIYKQDIDKSLRVHTAIASPSAGRHEHV